MGILDYFTPEARRGNREWLDSQNAAISEALRYYLGPTGIPERLGLLAESTPTAGLERAGTESSRMFAPGLSGWDRMAAAGNMLSETAGAGAGLLGMPAAGRMADDLVEAAAPAMMRFGVGDEGGLKLYHGSPRSDLTQLLPGPEGTGALGPGVYGSPFNQTAGLYAREGGKVYDFEAPDDLMYGAGARWDEIPSNVSPYQVWRDNVKRLVDAAPDDQKAMIAEAGDKMVGDGYPFFRTLAANLGSKEAAQDLYKRAGFKGLTAMVDGPEAVLFDPVNLAGAADAAAQQGSEIINLLRSGRAGEVTEQMLDMGDPVLNARLSEYLYSNYDLPMDTASRMGRAEGMGFVDALHGTGDEITAIDPSFFGSGQDLLGSGFYTTTAPARAERYVPREKSPGIEVSKNYAEGGNILPLSVREPMPFDLKEPLGKTADDIANYYANDPFFSIEKTSSGVTYVKDFDGNSVMLDPMQPKHWALQNLRKAFGPSETSSALSDLGFSGVSGPELGGNVVRNSYAPTDVRSRFARFDPRLSHLRNLNAALTAGVPLGLLAMQPGQEPQ